MFACLSLFTYLLWDLGVPQSAGDVSRSWRSLCSQSPLWFPYALGSSLLSTRASTCQRSVHATSCVGCFCMTALTAWGSAQITIMSGDELSFAAASCFTSIRSSMHHVLLFFFTPHLNLWAIRRYTQQEQRVTGTELNCSVTLKCCSMLVWQESTNQKLTSSLENKIRKRLNFTTVETQQLLD